MIIILFLKIESEKLWRDNITRVNQAVIVLDVYRNYRVDKFFFFFSLNHHSSVKIYFTVYQKRVCRIILYSQVDNGTLGKYGTDR